MPPRPSTPTPVRHVPDAERRARLATRHALAPAHQVEGGGADAAVAAARSVVALHATEPASVVLSAWARGPQVTPADVTAVTGSGRLVTQMAMRQTLFAMTPDLLPVVHGSICGRMAARVRQDVTKGAQRAGHDGPGWVDRAGEAVLAALERSEPLTTREVRERVPEADATYRQGEGTRWESTVRLTPRLLALLALEGRIVRQSGDTDWRQSLPRWTTTARGLGPVVPLPEREAYAELVSRWLATHGPGTVDDIAWWVGSTKGAVRAALTDLAAVAVSLDGTDQVGWLLPDDVEPVADPGPWVALLPLLDPSVMGWRERGWFLGEHAPALFDSVGNAGTTAWVDGLVVGVWVQDADEQVRLSLLEPVPAARRRELEALAARLSGWLDGQHVFSVYPSAAMRDATT